MNFYGDMPTHGIYAPYTRREATFAALRLAGILSDREQHVSVGCYGKRESGVHSDWDNYVANVDGQGFHDWIEITEHIIWFDVHKKKLAIAQEKGIENTLVMMWRRFRPEDLELLEAFDNVVFLSRDSYLLFEDKLCNTRAEVLPPWDSGLPPIRRRVPEFWQPIRYFIPLFGDIDPLRCRYLLSIAEAILQVDSSSRVTLCPTRATFPKDCRAALKALEKDSEGRFKVYTRKGYQQYLAELEKHDWFMWLSPANNVGVAIAEAAACGLPTVAFDVPPVGELVKDSHTGRLVPCELSYSPLGAPEAVVDEGAFIRVVEEIAGDKILLQRFREQIWLSRNCQAFEDACYQALVP
jgi:glycosyltransferase involved in cell wall biosynthesis